MALLDHVRSLLGVSAYQPAPPNTIEINDPMVKRIREFSGGQIEPLPTTRSRWYLADVETAEYAADSGDMTMPAQLMRTARRDGVYSGVLATRTDGLVRLPKKFKGRPDIVARLRGTGDEVRSVFDEMFPPPELSLLVADGLELGVGVGELVPVEGRDYPVLVRHSPEFLVYRWMENQWYFRSIAGMLPIVPGDGTWILHIPGGRLSPWQHGLWRAIGRAYIRKDHANNHNDNWQSKLANPARVAVSPQGAAEAQKETWWRQVMAWGVNTVFGVTPGYDVKLLESNGRGHESFEKTVADQNHEFVMAVCGQTVTTDGGTGFSNQDVHRSIRGDLIKSTADALAYTINTQGLTVYSSLFGEDAIENGAIVEWDVDPPRDKAQESAAMTSAASAVKVANEALAATEYEVDVESICQRFNIPVRLRKSTAPAVEPAAKVEEPALVKVTN